MTIRQSLGSMRLGQAFSGLLLVLPMMATQAGPNENSIADIRVCGEDESIASVCSSKELSNVVLQCITEESMFVQKLEEEDLQEILDDPHKGRFGCPEGYAFQAILVKSGSFKDPQAEGAPSGSGKTFFVPFNGCPMECPSPEDEGDDTGDDEEPPIDEDVE